MKRYLFLLWDGGKPALWLCARREPTRRLGYRRLTERMQVLQIPRLYDRLIAAMLSQHRDQTADLEADPGRIKALLEATTDAATYGSRHDALNASIRSQSERRDQCTGMGPNSIL